MTPENARRFRLGVLALCWLVAAGLQVYASDVGTHGAEVGAYVPDWLLAVARIPWWVLLVPVAIDGIASAVAAKLTNRATLALTIVNASGLVLYAFVAIAVLFYVAFANNGVA